MKFTLLILAIVAVVVGLIAGGLSLGGPIGNTMIALGVVFIIVAGILGALVYRGLQT